MGTLVAIEARAGSQALAEQAVESGFTAIHNAEALLHPTRSGSDLARLNGAIAGRRLPVKALTVAVLRLSRELCALSEGCFEPALPGGGSVMHWFPAGPRAIRLERRARIDLGGIAKGYAVDLAVAALRRAGASAGLVNAGGDLRVFGDASWPVMLRLGGATGATGATMKLRDIALAASDPACADPPREHRGYYGARSGGRQARPGAVAVMAPTAALADALTKVVMFAPPAQSARILARYGARALGI